MVRAVLLAAMLAVSMGARSSTPNFVVETADPQLCRQIAQTAETLRRDLALSWLGKTMPDWSAPCVMTVQVGPNLGAGGATTFVFDRGEVYGWRMTIQGSAERLFDSVLPHEITHMIFASHLRCPVPRWADEGGATSVEHFSEKDKHNRMLVQFLRSERGIPFNQMFVMKEYPRDVMPLYAQGYSLAEFLIQQAGRPKFLDFVTEGVKTDDWNAALAHNYGHRDLGVLQNTWLAWVRQGSPRLQPAPKAENVLAASTPLPRPESNLILKLASVDSRSPTSAMASAGDAQVWPVVPLEPVQAPRYPDPVRAQVTHPQPLGN
jgi:hypothetical protein